MKLLTILLVLPIYYLHAAPPDVNINDIVLNELLFNPGPSGTTNVGQNCDGDANSGEDGQNDGNAADEFIEFYNNTEQ